MYESIDRLEPEALRSIAAKQELQDMAPLNAHGKYHARYIKNAYPIAGTQLKLEKEREMILAAKKKLLLTKDPIQMLSSSHRELSLTHGVSDRSYRQLDFLSDRFEAMLARDEEMVRDANAKRGVRLVEVQHREGLEQFWRLMHLQHRREAVAWVLSHRFWDINVPVLVNEDRKSGLRVVPHKDCGRTPLMVACELLSVDLVAALLEQDAAIHLQTSNGDTAVHFLWRSNECWRHAGRRHSSLVDAADVALKASHAYAILSKFIARSADVDAQNAFGETALQHCARLGLEACVRLLLKHGADPNTVDRTGRSAVQYAREQSFQGIVDLLLNHGIIENTRQREEERRRQFRLLREKRGALSSEWSEPSDKLLARLTVEERRVGHLRNQYIDRHGNVILALEPGDK
ncbi:hypothetical protein P43SY_011453 [Pythium insidiosum]|uniref:Uncharacterized protein n=1 Tax=Pythium insidiosum TaxID=114742 RepID=A0AAD5LDS6_PYTIN|nr:hypothetical protein P43SY_011453 [Pythium insidiosum]